jgi:hypothetical protein
MVTLSRDIGSDCCYSYLLIAACDFGPRCWPMRDPRVRGKKLVEGVSYSVVLCFKCTVVKGINYYAIGFLPLLEDLQIWHTATWWTGL